MMLVTTGRGSRLFLQLILVLTTVFIWEAAGNRREDKAQGNGDSLTNKELHRLLSLFNTTPRPPTTSPVTASFLPTEVIPPQQLMQQQLIQLQQQLKRQRLLQQQQQPRPNNIVRRKDLLKSVNRNGDAASANLLQQLSVLSSFLEASGVQAQQGTTPVVQEQVKEHATTESATAPPSHAPPVPVDDQASALQSLALLSALLGGAGNSGNSGANLAALLGVDPPAPSSPVTRQTQAPPRNDDPAAAALTSLLLAQAGLGPQQLQQSSQAGDPQQNFQAFSNTQANLDPSASNQLGGLLSLLGTLGSLGNLAGGGGSQTPSLFNFGQQQQQQPNLLATLMGGGQQQASSTNLLAGLLGGNPQQQQQNNLLASLLGGQQGSSSSLFSQPQQQPPGVLTSLGNLGTSLFSVAGNTLGGLSGTRVDGKPRVRGVDTRLGVGYRLGQNADAQVMMEIGPQLFTEVIPGEHRPGIPANGVNSNALRDIRQPSTQHVQQLLQEELEKQKQVQRRNQVQLTSDELEHQRIGQLLHASGYYNSPNRAPNPPLQRRQQPPSKLRQMFPYHPPPGRYPTPINNFYRNIPHTTVLQARNNIPWNHNIARNNNPWNSNVPRSNSPLNNNVPNNNPWNNIAQNNNPLNNSVRSSRPTPTEESRPLSKPKPRASSESDSYSMLTEYEKWLVKRGASAQGLGPSSSVAKRMLPFTDENSELSRGSLAMASPPKVIPKTQFSFHGARDPNPTNPSSTNSASKIVRMTQKRPATLKSDAFASRVGNFPREHQSPPRPPPNFRRPNPGPYPMPPFRHPQSGRRNNVGYPVPPVRRNDNAGHWKPQPQVRRYHGIQPNSGFHGMPQNTGYSRPRPPIRRSDPNPQPPKNQIDRSSYNPYQNFVMEADDSFLRRNAQSNIQNEKMESSPGVSVTVNLNAKPSDHGTNIQPLETAMTVGSTAFNVLKQVIKPAVKYFRPSVDSLHPFTNLKDYEGGDYTPTKEPILIATPTPTPVPSLYDHMGKKNPNHPDQTPEEQANAVVHVGEGLTYEDLASSLRISPKGRKRKKKPGKGSSDSEDIDVAESKMEGPVNAPGVEMFIDIESGELSVRKPIASLSHFGEVTTTTTPEPEPKTEDEIEDEESAKIFENLQEHFKDSYENFRVTQAAVKAAKERKEKIKTEQDESLGLVNRYFDLLTDDRDEETAANRRRKRVDSVRISEHRN